MWSGGRGGDEGEVERDRTIKKNRNWESPKGNLIMKFLRKGDLLRLDFHGSGGGGLIEEGKGKREDRRMR